MSDGPGLPLRVTLAAVSGALVALSLESLSLEPTPDPSFLDTPYGRSRACSSVWLFALDSALDPVPAGK